METDNNDPPNGYSPDIENLPILDPELLPTLVQLMQFFIAPTSGIYSFRPKHLVLILKKVVVILQLVSQIYFSKYF